MIKLAKSPVVFNEQDHTYFLGDKQLQGVTGILQRRLFPDKHSDIPQHILENAAKRGTHVHKMCELVDTFDIVPDNAEAQNYAKLKQENGLVSIEAEYLVSDNEHYASSIDAVYEGLNGGVVLNDRKTTSKLDKESVSWQLSIYALFFEQQNPGIKVEGLTATWLRGASIAEYVPIERKPNSLVRALLLADINDEPFEYTASDIPRFIAERLDTMVLLNKRIKAMQGELDELKKEIEGQMMEQGIKSVSTPYASFSYTEARLSSDFDKAAFKAANPELYNQFLKETNKKPFLTIKFK